MASSTERTIAIDASPETVWQFTATTAQVGIRDGRRGEHRDDRHGDQPRSRFCRLHEERLTDVVGSVSILTR